MIQTECTTFPLSGCRIRHSCGFFVPASLAAQRHRFLWRVDRWKYKTRKGNTTSRLNAVVETRRPTLGGLH
jgi:hypothetical protein